MTRTADPFAPVAEVAAVLADFPRLWSIAGGWAIDLFLGRKTREHADVDVAILRRDQRDLRSFLRAWSFEKVSQGGRGPWPEGEWLSLPIHEVYARRSSDTPREIEFLLNEARDETWVFRRDSRVTRPLSEVRTVSRAGIPFLTPETVLLYKAKDPTAKDLEDFERIGARLGSEGRIWLRSALETVHPGHPWLARL